MQKKRVLVVEDDTIVARDIGLSLKTLGYEVAAVAYAAEEAVREAARLKPDVVLMDITLRGGGDGIEAARRITAEQDIPVVYLTSLTDPQTLRRARETAPLGYLMKPCTDREIEAALEMALYKHSMESALREREEWLTVTLGSIADAVVVADRQGRVSYMNRAAEALTGMPLKEARMKDVAEVFPSAGGTNPASGPLREALQKGGTRRGEGDVRMARNGVTAHIESTAALLRGGPGSLAGAVLVLRDVTRSREAQRQVESSRRFLAAVFDSIRDPLCILDRRMVVVRANEAYARFLRKPLPEVMGRACLAGESPVCEERLVADTFRLGKSGTSERPAVLPGGRKGWLESTAFPMLDDKGVASHVVLHTREITERKQAEEERKRLIRELEVLSKVDPITGLFNRRALMDFLRHEMAKAKRYETELSVILCDVDLFKEINDTFGHAAGDRALSQVSETLRTKVRRADVVGRYGGDEFILLMPQTSLSGARDFAERVREEIASMEFSPAEGKVLRLSLSLGVAALDRERDTADSLVSRADTALYRSKRAGRNRVSLEDW
jgi:diguanylate cyclase (GGDEF)-like protein/PAS domain S-box-containing protein